MPWIKRRRTKQCPRPGRFRRLLRGTRAGDKWYCPRCGEVYEVAGDYFSYAEWISENDSGVCDPNRLGGGIGG